MDVSGVIVGCTNITMPALEQIASVPQIAVIKGADERRVAIDGVNWRYWVAGSGPPLLLIHGFLGYSFSWRFNVEALSQDFTVYAIDLPGCGFSERSDETDCSLTGDAERVLRFMQVVGIEN